MTHILSFSKKHRLNIENRRSVIALSGGVDSVSLLKVMSLLHDRGMIAHRPRAIFIDHQTRKEIKSEKKAMKSFCDSLGVDLKVFTAEFEKTKNLEKNARDARYKIFKDHLFKGEILLLGHHLGDSLEWSLLKSLKSSQVESSLGIPVLNGVIRRPFLCVSKKHIIKFAKQLNLRWFEDHTNEDESYERNLIRSHLVSLEKSFPKLYAHHASRSNSLSKKLGVHVNNQIKTQDFSYIKREWGYIYCHERNNHQSFEKKCENCLELIYLASRANRGKVRQQFEKLKDLVANNKIGELYFSGGVRFFHFQKVSLILKAQKEISFYDSSTQIPGAFPFFVQTKKKKSLKNAAFISSLNDNEALNYFYRYPNAPIKYWI